MIHADQPNCFPDSVEVVVSSRQDGTVLDRTQSDRHDKKVVANRMAFCVRAGIDYRSCAYQIISYEPGTSFDTITEIKAPNLAGIVADVLYTETPGVGIFLPIADCVPAIVYDVKRKALAVAHLGRHASIAKTFTKTLEYFTQKGSNPTDLLVWMGPSVAKQDYVLEYFDYLEGEDWKPYAERKSDGIHLDLAGYNKNLAIKSHVPAANIFVSDVNTAKDSNYFSHSHGDTDGRFAVVAMIR